MAAGSETDQLRVLQRAVGRSGLTPEALWRRYFALGGAMDAFDMDAYLAGLTTLPAMERDLLAQAANELLDEQPLRRRVPYSRPLREPRPEKGPLAALLTALEEMHLAPPERIGAATAAAGAALDAEITMYLVDYEQQALHAVPSARGGTRGALGVDSSVAGRAFRELRTHSSRADGTARLWVPLLDGVERLGALEVVPRDPADIDDPVLRSHLTWISAVLGHLVTVTGDYGDGVDAVRRRRPRSAAAELIWQLLPPLTAATDRVVVTGVVEPAYAVGGDAFDHALSETTAKLAIFDATGHSLDSGLIAARALSAYRASRRNGGSLFDQSMAVHDIIGGVLDRTGLLITSVLAELDLSSGRLRYINAGHPSPLLLRGGKVVKRLTGGRRPIFGIPATSITVGEEMLEPGDWLVLYTDGITEARDSEGSFFGTARLEDFLEREALSGHPPPETARRLVRNVMEHQRGVLQDDATVVLATWGDYRQQLTP